MCERCDLAVNEHAGNGVQFTFPKSIPSLFPNNPDSIQFNKKILNVNLFSVPNGQEQRSEDPRATACEHVVGSDCT